MFIPMESGTSAGHSNPVCSAIAFVLPTRMLRGLDSHRNNESSLVNEVDLSGDAAYTRPLNTQPPHPCRSPAGVWKVFEVIGVTECATAD